MAAHFSLAQHLLNAATEHPAAVALLCGKQRWSFAKLLGNTHALAAQLGSDQSSFIQTGNSLHLCQCAYAYSFEKRPFWPVDRSNQTAQLTHNNPLPEITELLRDVALIISTSGSEGKPRAVRLGNGQLDAAAAGSNQCLSLQPGDLWLNCLPLYHIGGQSILWRCARAAAGVLLHDGFSVAAVANDLQRHPVTHISLVPAMLAQLLEKNIPPPTSLRVTLIGGAALSRPLYDKAIAAGWPLYPSYGMSESAAQIATFDPANGIWHEGLVGKPMPGHEIKIDDDGRIAIRGPQIMLGYLSGDGVDAEGWLTTGDLGSIDATGCLTVTGRADDMLISGGRNVHPFEVESCLAACPGVRDVAVTGQPDPVWGYIVVALIVGTVEQKTLLDHARQHLPTAALPRKICFIEQLPRNPNGKIDRAALRHIAAEAN